MKALVVEDDFTNRLLLQACLAPYGECHIAVNGKEAVEAFRAAGSDGSGYDLICMDILMPEMNGDEALRAIRGIEEATGVLPRDSAKIIMTTVIDDLKQVRASFEGLCDAYLLKPIDRAKLIKELQRLGVVAH